LGLHGLAPPRLQESCAASGIFYGKIMGAANVYF